MPDTITMSMLAPQPGWLVGFLVAKHPADQSNEYRVLPVIAIERTDDGYVPIVMTPTGRILPAADVGEVVFSVAPGEDVQKIARAHAAMSDPTWGAHVVAAA